MPKTKTSKSGKQTRSQIVARRMPAIKPEADRTKKTSKSRIKITAPKSVKTEKVAAVSHLSITVTGIDGKAKGKITLPQELFNATVNDKLIAQAVRVHLANQREGSASTKTRTEVTGSTRKIFKQKGTGRARHGSIRSPIFVGGGIVFGPKPRDYSLRLTKDMRSVALAGALTAQYKNGNIICLDGLTGLEPKTKRFAKVFETIDSTKNVLLLVTKDAQNIERGARNLPYLHIIPATDINTYEILTHEKIIVTKEVLKQLGETFIKKQQ